MSKTTGQEQTGTLMIHRGLLSKAILVLRFWWELVFKPKTFFKKDLELIENGAGIGVFCFVVGRIPSLLLLSFYLFEAPKMLRGVDFSVLGVSKFFVLPLFAIVGVVVWLAIYFFTSFLIARALGGKGSVIENGLCFCCSLSPSLFNFIPLVGVFLPFYESYILALGFMHFHNLSRRRALIAAFLPLLILVSIGFVFVFMFAAMMIEQI
jgi:hypothetical protein